jgi:hypothetical protein
LGAEETPFVFEDHRVSELVIVEGFIGDSSSFDMVVNSIENRVLSQIEIEILCIAIGALPKQHKEVTSVDNAGMILSA